jgi:hypothetical protein
MRRALAASLLLALGAAGCATTPTATLGDFAQRSADNSFEIFERGVRSQDALVLPVVHDRQTSGPSCGAHALASIINYWRGADTVTGDQLFAATPPAQPQGYSVAELVSLAASRDLLASAVRMPEAGIIDELERGRPVLVPVRLPSIYIQGNTLPGENEPGLDIAAGVITYRVGRLSELTGLAMVDHYLLVAGYDGDRFIVVEPVRGFRTISATKLSRYREHFGNAAIVFSAAPQVQHADTGENAERQANIGEAQAPSLQLQAATRY